MENSGRHIYDIIFRTICTRHGGGGGGACYMLESSNGVLLPAVCGKRIREAGFRGKISDESVRRKSKFKA